MTPKTFFFITYYAFFSPYKHLLFLKILKELKKYVKILPYQKGGGVEMVQVTYQKNNGTIFKRYRYTAPSYKVGERTSMGWIVLNVEYEYNNEYYPEYKYNLLLQKQKQDIIKKREISEQIRNEMKNFMYCFIALVIIKCIKMLLGI